MRRGRAGAGGGSVNPLPMRARPWTSCVVPGAPAGRVEVPVLRKAHSGWFGVLDHFSFGCFSAGSPQSCGRAARRGRTEGGCGEGMMLGWTWTLRQPGSRPAPAASPGQMLRHQPAGLVPILPSTGMPRAGCVERLGLAPHSQAGPCFVRGCRRNAVTLRSVHATLDFSELHSGTLCFAGVTEAACAATAGDTGRAFAAAVGFFLESLLLRGCCAA